MVSGVSKCLASGAFAVGDMLMVDANGKFLLATTGNQVVGIALESGVAGAVVAVLLKDIGLI
jgi:regulator of RNase E activity RraA